MTYIFKQLFNGPRWGVIKSNLPRRSAGEAYARDWFIQHGYSIVLLDQDEDNDAIDIMTAKHGDLYQFAIECDHN